MVNCANIDWFFPWPEQALYAVASVFISPDVSSIQLILLICRQQKMSTKSRTVSGYLQNCAEKYYKRQVQDGFVGQ